MPPQKSPDSTRLPIFSSRGGISTVGRAPENSRCLSRAFGRGFDRGNDLKTAHTSGLARWALQGSSLNADFDRHYRRWLPEYRAQSSQQRL